MTKKMTPMMAMHAKGMVMPRQIGNPMDESMKHEMKAGDAKADLNEAKPNPKAPLGQGGRFAALKQKLASKPGVTDPAALAASIGRKKLGKAKFQELAAKGKTCKAC